MVGVGVGVIELVGVTDAVTDGVGVGLRNGVSVGVKLGVTVGVCVTVGVGDGTIQGDTVSQFSHEEYIVVSNTTAPAEDKS